MRSSGVFDDVSILRGCEQCGTCSSACPLTGVDGFNIRRILRHVELGLEEEIVATPLAWRCAVCARCESACPNGVPVLDIIRRLRAAAPAEHVPEGPAPCVAACPAGIDVPGYLRLIAQREPTLAYELILRNAPFPGVLGRVCPRPCETACRRGEVNEPVAICALKRHAADRAGELSVAALRVGEGTGRRVAVVGAGPAGLTAAFYLRKKGHAVTVFEARAKAGGMMRYGIPRYRLPEEVLDREIRQLLDTGIELETGQRFGAGLNLSALRERGFDAVLLAVGLQRSKTIDLEGAGHPDVSWGVDFLTRLGAGSPPGVRERVAVIGGGDVAIDVALTARRLGAGRVVLACLESREEMPAHPREVAQALEEGVELLTSWGPLRVIVEDGRVRGVDLVRCVSVFDEAGRFRPTFGDDRTALPAEQVILAIGQVADLGFVERGAPLRIVDGLVVVSGDSSSTGVEGLFAAGEIATGPRDLVAAVAEGRKAARAIDAYLGGDGLIDGRPPEPVAARSYDGRRERGFADRRRAEPPALPAAERLAGFREVEQGLEDESAVAEAKRCLDCDLECNPRRLLR